jgi:uncharacterized protein YdiU (UPF0061 family)
MRKLASIEFDDLFIRSLPGDPISENVCRQVTGACYSLTEPTPVASPRLAAWSEDLAADFSLARPLEGSTDLAILAGNALAPGMKPYAACYGGHQFGHWAGQLGDGRAITLGEILNRHGERWELQLKGAGPTPYSRRADGRAVLRSSIREFLCSEAMYHLGVPTTRALSLVATGEDVIRDLLYDGNPRPEPGAIVTRMSPSFIRFGNFEIFAARGDVENLRKLADHVLRHHFPDLGEPGEDIDVKWFTEICRRTALLMVEWMRVGFVHGVMNTDNMSILGLTIDYGPYGWMDVYDPDWTPNTTDAGRRRYRFGHQPSIALWNLLQLAEALAPLVKDPEFLIPALDSYKEIFGREMLAMMGRKLGVNLKNEDADLKLLGELDRVLRLVETDMTIFYRELAKFHPFDLVRGEDFVWASLTHAFYPDSISEDVKTQWQDWLRAYGDRVLHDEPDLEERRERMNRANPKFLPRNYLVQECIEAAEAGDFSKIEEFLQILRHPYDEQPGQERFAARRPEWARQKPGCSALSCSS